MDNEAIPLLKKFRTKDHYYAYAAAGNRILMLTDAQFDILNWFGEMTKREIIEMLMDRYPLTKLETAYKTLDFLEAKYNLFFTSEIENRVEEKNSDYFVKNLSEKLTSIKLEITQDCNFRCRYCFYSGGYKDQRMHSKKRMDWKTAHTAIDFLYKKHKRCDASDFINCKNNGCRNPGYLIGFDGGEPLLEIEMIKHCVEYALSLNWRQPYKPVFQITTNGSLLTDETICYLLDNDIRLSVSLDGPEEINNRYRVSLNKSGTFKLVMDRLMRLEECIRERSLPDDKSYTYQINCLIAPSSDVQQIHEFYSSLFKNHLLHARLNLSELAAGNELFMKRFPSCSGNKVFNGILSEKYFQGVTNGYNCLLPENLFMEEYIGKSFTGLNLLEKENSNSRDNFTNRPCIPGKCFPLVDVNGNIHICDKAKRTLSIGNVFSGFDYQMISSLWNQYAKIMDSPECRTCFAMNHCKLCYSHLVEGQRLKNEKKLDYCDRIRSQLITSLIEYCSILEVKKDAFRYMDTYL